MMEFGQTVLYEGSSDYGSYKIVEQLYDGRPARVLYGDNRSAQSGVPLDDNPDMLFDYNQRFLEMMQDTQPQSILIIGGGAGTMALAAFHILPDATIDVVEVDQLVVELAQKYFGLPDDPRLSLFIQDGKTFLETHHKKYDMIVLDAFSGYHIPAHLLETSAVVLYRSHLNKNGLVALNFIAGLRGVYRDLTVAIDQAFTEVLSYHALHQASPDYPTFDEQNFLYVASDQPMNLPSFPANDLIDQLYLAP